MITPFFNGKRLREARRFRQLSMPQLAERLGVSKQMVFKYEHGEAQPSPKVYQKILIELDFPIAFFQKRDTFGYSDMGTFYRSRLSSTQSEKKPSELLKKYLAVLTNFFETYVDFPKLDDIELSDDPVEAAAELRKVWNLGMKPISSMVNLLEIHGFPIAFINSNSEKVDAFGSQIKVNDTKYYCMLVDERNNTFFRQQFSLAHELGHWALHSKSVNPQELDTLEYKEIEDQANLFAACFLLPDKEFIRTIDPSKKDDLDMYLYLKSYWKVSVASMVFRARNLGVIDSEQYIRIQKRMSARGWRKVEPFDDVTPIRRPVLLKQAYRLISEHRILKNNSINDTLSINYGVELPNDILAELINISIDELIENEGGRIIKIKR